MANIPLKTLTFPGLDDTYTIPKVDNTLATAGDAADAKKTGDEISQIKADLDDVNERIDGLGDGVPTTVRQAIKTLFETGGYADISLTDEMAVISSWASQVTAITLNQTSIPISGSSTSQLVATTTPAGGTVTWASSDTSVATVSSSGLVTGVGNGSCTITASCGGKNATCSVTVSGFATLTSISAVYTQSGTVYNTDTLDSLKDDLVVTAHYDDTTTATVPSADYTLSGTLEVGTSTIVVSYGEKTTTFTVTVTEYVPIAVTYAQGSVGAGNSDANRVSGVITDSLHFDVGETLVISIPSGYSIYPEGFSCNSDESKAGTRSGANVLYVYAVSDSSYVYSANTQFSGTFTANETSLKGNGNAGWKTSSVTYEHTPSSEYGVSMKGLGFVIKKTDESNITPSEIEQIISVERVVSS